MKLSRSIWLFMIYIKWQKMPLPDCYFNHPKTVIFSTSSYSFCNVMNVNITNDWMIDDGKKKEKKIYMKWSDKLVRMGLGSVEGDNRAHFYWFLVKVKTTIKNWFEISIKTFPSCCFSSFSVDLLIISSTLRALCRWICQCKNNLKFSFL